MNDSSPATLILENAIVFSGRTPPLPGTSVAISGNRISAVGASQEINRYVSPKIERMDLQGRTVVPGFIDSHTCFATDCRRKIDQCNLGEKPLTQDKLAEVLREAAKKLEPGEWLLAGGFSEGTDEQVYPFCATDLDRIISERPVILLSAAKNFCLLNHQGMEALCLTKEIVDTEGVEAERDREFTPNGRFHGKVERILPDGFPCHDLTTLKLKMKKLGKRFLACGITTICDIDVYRPLDAAAYASLHQENTLPLRVIMMLRGFPRDDRLRRRYLETGLRTGFGDAWMRLGAMKFSVDGVIGNKTAALSQPWFGTQNRYGQIYFSKDELAEEVREAAESGFQLAFHAIGDRAIETVIDAIQMAQAQLSRPLLRPRIHHCSLPNPDHIRIMKEIGAIPIGHAHFIRYMGDANLRSLGEQRIRTGYFPFRAFLDQGIPAVLSAEPILPMEQISPLIGIATAMTRETSSGKVLAQDQKVTLEEAIRMYTLHAAYATFEEDEKGTIAPGKLADIVVLETDIRELAPERLAKVAVDYTLLNGKVVYARK